MDPISPILSFFKFFQFFFTWFQGHEFFLTVLWVMKFINVKIYKRENFCLDFRFPIFFPIFQFRISDITAATETPRDFISTNQSAQKMLTFAFSRFLYHLYYRTWRCVKSIEWRGPSTSNLDQKRHSQLWKCRWNLINLFGSECMVILYIQEDIKNLCYKLLFLYIVMLGWGKRKQARLAKIYYLRGWCVVQIIIKSLCM